MRPGSGGENTPLAFSELPIADQSRSPLIVYQASEAGAEWTEGGGVGDVQIHPVAALAGFALVGLGFANVVPVLFSAAAQVPGVTPAHGIAAVSALGYLGMMAGPPLIGVIAEARSLGVGLSVVVLFAAVLVLAARRALAWRPVTCRSR